MSSAHTFFFYDLETSGFDPRTQRIMQFAGQRTDIDFKPIGEPINILIKLTDDILPDPQAVLITGITPQKTQTEGYTEAEFLKILHQKVFLPGTIMTGFNNVRFDDEFMRFSLYRNFYDPYEWSWKDGASRWDILDVVRMTRALRPGGIQWPVDQDGQPTNRLELLTQANGLDHANAHDALSDVLALIAVAKLIKEKQPKLFDYLLKMRDKKEVAALVSLDNPQPFIYSSGRYPKGSGHTTAAYPLVQSNRPGAVIVYDLRHDPTDWATMSVAELKEVRFANYETRQMEGFVALPVKELAYNKCPAVAPLGVLDTAAEEHVKLDMQVVKQNLALLLKTDLADKVQEVFTRDSQFTKTTDVDAQLYDSFINNRDKPKMAAVRAATIKELADFDPGFADERLAALLLRYKARNFPHSLSESEQQSWEAYRKTRIQADLPKFMNTIGILAQQAQTTQSHFLLEELQLWAQGIAPLD